MFRAALTGGAPTRIADGIDNPRGIDWCGEEIVYNRDVSSGLFKVSTQGGPAIRLTSLDSARREKSHRFPHVLPGCGAVLFTIGTSTTESWDDGDLAIASMETGQYRTVLAGGVFARYSPSGHIVYNRGGTLYAAAFDLERLQVTGPPVPVVTEAMSVPHGGSSEFALAQNGTLVYAPGRSKMADRQLVRIDRRGSAEPFLETPREFASFRLSPDGRHVAAQIRGGIDSIWLFDIARGAPTRWTTEWDHAAPIWDPTSRHIMFTSPRQSAYDLYQQPVDGGGPNRANRHQRVHQGRHFVVARRDDGRLPGAGRHLRPAGRSGREAHALREFQSQGAKRRLFSERRMGGLRLRRERPGRSVRATVSRGRGPPAQVSVDGGTNPVWNPDGTELFYRNGPRMMAAAIQDARNMVVARPQVLYERRFGGSLDDRFDVTPDGRYFIDLDDAVAEPPPTEVVLVQHFADELRRLAPPGR